MATPILNPALRGGRRRVAGVMSGTSLDGIDVVFATLEGTGADIAISDIELFSEAYSASLRSLILANSSATLSSVADLSQLNVRLAYAYADAVRRAVIASTFEPPVLVGSHGQTVQHLPVAADCCGVDTRSTLQIGDPSTLANLLALPVVGDFRMADMAHGGQGAPLVPYFDEVVLRHDREHRLALNLGGIANFTLLPARATPEASGHQASVRHVSGSQAPAPPASGPPGLASRGSASPGSAPHAAARAMDTGPANMVIDALARRFLDAPFDEGGETAAGGVVNKIVLERYLDDEYFRQPPPKTTGRERFGEAFVARFVDDLHAAGSDQSADMLSTATELTVRSIHNAYTMFVAPALGANVDRVIASGGGTRNDFLMTRLRTVFAPVVVDPIDDYGVPSSAKEALCFALLAHEYLNGVPTNVPAATGASGVTMLGKLCLPPAMATAG